MLPNYKGLVMAKITTIKLNLREYCSVIRQSVTSNEWLHDWLFQTRWRFDRLRRAQKLFYRSPKSDGALHMNYCKGSNKSGECLTCIYLHSYGGAPFYNFPEGHSLYLKWLRIYCLNDNLQLQLNANYKSFQCVKGSRDKHTMLSTQVILTDDIKW